MLKPEEKIRKKLERFERIRDRKFKSLDEGRVPEENLPKVYLSIGSKAFSIGLYKLSLGECGDSVTDFEFAAEWYNKGVYETRQRRNSLSDDFEGGERLLNYLYVSILSKNEELLDQAAELCLNTSEKHYDQFSTNYRYYFMKALAATIRGTGDEQRYLNELGATLPELPDDHYQFFDALWTILTGITQSNSDQFYSGTNQFLEWHENNKIDLESRTSADDLICKQITSFIIVANQKDMDVRVESPYIPECIYEWV